MDDNTKELLGSTLTTLNRLMENLERKPTKEEVATAIDLVLKECAGPIRDAVQSKKKE
jgi:hypothetical protein